MVQYTFEWDDHKDALNQERHGVAFFDAQEAFYDRHRIVAHDEVHSEDEPRFFCIGQTPKGILTVRFTVHRPQHSYYWSGQVEKMEQVL